MNTQLDTEQKTDIEQIQKTMRLSNNKRVELLNKTSELEQVKISDTVTLYTKDALQTEMNQNKNDNSLQQKAAGLKNDCYYLLSEVTVKLYAVNNAQMLKDHLNDIIEITESFYLTMNEIIGNKQ